MNFAIQENDSTGNNPVTQDAVVSATIRNMTSGVSTMEISTVIAESADVSAAPTSKNKDHVASASAPAVTPVKKPIKTAKIFYAKSRTWWDIDTNEPHEEGQVKDDWICQLCMYNSGKNRCHMFKGCGNGRFKIFCHQCAAMGSMLDFLIGDGSEKRVSEFLKSIRKY